MAVVNRQGIKITMIALSHENKRDGKVVWDDHGTKCGVCLEIAAQSVSDLESGKSIKQIRQSIDEKYKSGYAKPTPTPEV